MSEFLYSLFGFIVALGILVTVHEFGHFWVARRLGVKVLRFSIGFGAPIWSRRAGLDDTEYVVAAIPLGGYVKMLDENEGEVDPADLHRAFNRKPLISRSAIVLAGPAFNFLFAVFAYWMISVIGVEGVRPIVGKVVDDSIAADSGFRAGDEITRINGRANRSWDEHRLYLFYKALQGEVVLVDVRDSLGTTRALELDLTRLGIDAVDAGILENGLGLIGYLPSVTLVLDQVVEESPAARAGLRPGDRIIEVDGKAVHSWEQDVVTQVRAKPDKPMQFLVERSGQELVLEVTPGTVTVGENVVGQIGVAPTIQPFPDDMRVTLKSNPLIALGKGIESTWIMSALTVRMLWKMVQLEVSTKNISGPITIAQYAGQYVRVGMDGFLLFLAVVSISLGILNLLPIPILDGGHLLYYAIEAVTGGPVSKQVMLWGQQVGIVMLFGLMSLAFYNDIVRLLQ
ncbi:MAG: RIP metalloprotease RseP [Gammaproteobacteria bacterium]|nr:RIP metalloprotease RseP [Gammaproteobacteria bacterium]